MKLRKAVKYAVVGTLAAAPGLASAANNPLTIHGQWSLSGSTINDNMQASVTCGTLTSGTGFLQQECNDGNRTYFRTIVAETGFSDESFVVENGAGGLSGKQSISAGTFQADSTFNTGGEFMPMNNLGSNPTLTQIQNASDMITLSQSYSNTADEFTTTFDFAHGMVMDSTNGGMAKYALLTLGQDNADSAGGFSSGFDLTENEYEGATGSLTNADASRTMGITADLTGGIVQHFELAEAEGQANPTGGTVSHLNGATTTFNAGDLVAGVQIWQNTGTSEGLFSFGRFDDETTSTGLAGHTLAASGTTVTVTPDPFGSPYNF